MSIRLTRRIMFVAMIALAIMANRQKLFAGAVEDFVSTIESNCDPGYQDATTFFNCDCTDEWCNGYQTGEFCVDFVNAADDMCDELSGYRGSYSIDAFDYCDVSTNVSNAELVCCVPDATC